MEKYALFLSLSLLSEIIGTVSGFGSSILGSYIGKLILVKTSERIFRFIVLGVIIITALFQVITVLNK
jgi:hypothetical protein